MASSEKLLIAFRSKKNGRYFKFHEYCDDGWGKLEATENWDYDDSTIGLPTFYSKYESERLDGLPEFLDHERKDIELIVVTMVVTSLGCAS